jgi:hypothetical protein
MRKVFLAALTVLGVASFYSETSSGAEPSRFLCIVDFVGGLHYDRSSHVWGVTQFKPGHKYIIRRSTDDDAHGKFADMYSRWTGNKGVPDWLVFDIDSKYPDTALASCSDRNYIETLVICSNDIYEFDKQTLRFQYTYQGGYMSQGSALHEKEHPSSFPNGYNKSDEYKQYLESAEQPDDASFSIGKCAPF